MVPATPGWAIQRPFSISDTPMHRHPHASHSKAESYHDEQPSALPFRPAASLLCRNSRFRGAPPPAPPELTPSRGAARAGPVPEPKGPDSWAAQSQPGSKSTRSNSACGGPRRRDQGCEARHEFKGAEEQTGPPILGGLAQLVGDCLLVDGRQPARGEGRAGAVASQPLEGVSVPGIDAHRGIQGEATFVTPLEHVLDGAGTQPAVALEVSPAVSAAPGSQW